MVVNRYTYTTRDAIRYTDTVRGNTHDDWRLSAGPLPWQNLSFLTSIQYLPIWSVTETPMYNNCLHSIYRLLSFPFWDAHDQFLQQSFKKQKLLCFAQWFCLFFCFFLDLLLPPLCALIWKSLVFIHFTFSFFKSNQTLLLLI